jgi:hypothetical protein
MRSRPGVLLLTTLLMMSGCSNATQRVIGTRKDPYAVQRGQFLNKERALHEAPPGAQLEGQYGLQQRNGNGGSLASLIIPDRYGIQNVVDFYLNLFAQQHHQNLTLFCSTIRPSAGLPPGYDGYGIAAAGWNGKYGYTITIYFERDDSNTLRLYKKYSTPGTFEIGVTINTATNPDMVAPTNERPIHQCPNYSYDRMAKVLKPFGLKPFSVPENWADYPYRPDASPNTDRKTPPNT